MNNELRLMIAQMVQRSGEGHIPSCFSIVDLIEFLYRRVLKITLMQLEINMLISLK